MSWRLLFFFVLALFSLSSVNATTSLKVMTFNIRFDGAEGEMSDAKNAWISSSETHRRDLVMQTILEADASLVCVQEALINQVHDLRQRLRTHSFGGVGRDDGKLAGEHCGIFYRRDRFRLVKQGNFWLNKNSDVPGSKFPKTCCARIATWVILQDLDSDGREFLLINTHWDHQVQAARIFSAKLIREKMKALAEGRPVLIAGDLNVTDDNPAFTTLMHGSAASFPNLVDSYRQAHPQTGAVEGTYHGFRGHHDGSRIDYVLHTQRFQTLSAKILRNHEGERYPSDHFPVVATLAWSED